MAVTIKSVTVGTNATVSATVAVTTSESPSTTSIGDAVLVLQMNDFYTLASMPASPSATGSPTMNAITGTGLPVDAGSNQGHCRPFWYVANTGGAQTITSAAETGTHDEEKAIIAIVFSGANTSTFFEVAAGAFQTTSSATSPAPSVSPTATDDYIVALAFTGGGGTSNTYTPPGGMTEQVDQNVASGMSLTVGTQQLVASGATGTFAFVPSVSVNYNCVTVAIKTAAGAAAAAPPPLSANPGKTWRRRYKHRQILPLAAVVTAVDQTVSPVGAATNEMVGQSTLAASYTLIPAGIATSEAAGQASLSATYTLAPNAAATSDAVGQATLTTSYTLSPAGIPSSELVGQTALAQGVAPAGISSGETVGQAVLTPGTVTVSPVGISSGERVGQPTLTTSYTLAPVGIATSETVGQAALGLAVSPAAIPSSETVGQSTLTPGTVTVSPAGIGSGELVGQSSVSLGAVQTISPAGIASGQQAGNPTLSPGTATLSPTGADTTGGVGQSTLTPGAVTLSPAGVTSAQLVGMATVAAIQTLAAIGIPTGEALGLPVLTLGPPSSIVPPADRILIVYPEPRADLIPLESRTGLIVADPPRLLTAAADPRVVIVPQEGRVVPAQYLKDSNATLDYGINWAPWLGVDTISASAWTVQTGLTTATPAPSFTTTTTTIWLSGGTVGSTYMVTNRVTTAAGRIDDRTFTVEVIDR